MCGGHGTGLDVFLSLFSRCDFVASTADDADAEVENGDDDDDCAGIRQTTTASLSCIINTQYILPV